MKNKNKVLLISSFLINILLIISVVFIVNDKTSTLKTVKNTNEVKNKQFAVMLQNESGGYAESESSSWPTSGYELNTTLTNCTDETGTKLENVLRYENGNIAVKSNKKLYCYLYFDKGYNQIINYTMLYDNGDECTEITGGWGQYYTNESGTEYFKTHTLLEKRASSLYGYASGGSAISSLGTNNFIDTTDYNYVGIFGNAINQTSRYGTVEIQISSSDDSTDANLRHSSHILQNVRYGVTERKFVVSPLRKSETNYHEPSGTEPYIWFENTLYDDNCRFYALIISYGDSGIEEAEFYNIFLTKPDNYTKLLEISGINNYSSLEELISDTIAITTILNNEKAVDFMLKQCTGDFMASFIANSNCLTALENSPYKDLVYENEHWAKFLTMAQQ